MHEQLLCMIWQDSQGNRNDAIIREQNDRKMSRFQYRQSSAFADTPSKVYSVTKVQVADVITQSQGHRSINYWSLKPSKVNLCLHLIKRLWASHAVIVAVFLREWPTGLCILGRWMKSSSHLKLVSIICRKPGGRHKHGRGRQEVTSRRRACTMLLLELGIWIIPFTLVLAPCRRLVLLVSRIQGFRECVLRSRSTSPAIWSRLARLNTMTFVI